MLLYGMILGVCLSTSIAVNTYIVLSAKKQYDRKKEEI